MLELSDLTKNVTEKNQKFVTIAKISGVYGIKGQLKIHSFTEPRSAFLNYKTLYWNYNGSWELMPVNPKSIKALGDSVVLSLIGCEDRDVAKQYQTTEIAVKRDSLPELEDNQYYWTDLEGMTVYTIYRSEEQELSKPVPKYLGVVDSLMETGSNDVIIVKNPHTKTTHLVPYLLETYVLNINLEDNTMLVDWDPEF